MNALRNAAFICLTLQLTAVACGNDDGGAIPEPNDNTGGIANCSVQPTFTSIYTQRLSLNGCANASCHGGTNPSAMLSFDLGQAETYAQLLNVASTSDAPKIRVVAGDAAASYLFEKLDNPNVSGLLGLMPPGSQLPQCEIDSIETWINGGAAND
ncbi:MAG: hypothetical protein AAFN74_11600 [Myxococcota bacterium]